MKKKFNVKFQDNKILGGFDGNQDGENSVSLEVLLGEAYQELFDKGEAVVEVKKLRVKRDGAKVALLVDTDQDGEHVLKLEADLIEAVEEAI